MRINPRRDKLIKTGMAARILHVHPKTLWQWERKGWLKPLRDWNGHRLYKPKDIYRIKRGQLSEGAYLGQISRMYLSMRNTYLRLGISHETLRRWCNNGVIKSVRASGGCRMFLAKEVDRVAAKMQPK